MTAPASAPSTAAARPRRARSWIGWAVVVVLVLGGGLLTMLIADTTRVSFRDGQDPESAGGSGTLALAEILRDQGVDVHVVRSRTEAAAALDTGTTLVMTDPFPLTDEAVTALLERADDVVLLSASTRMLRLLDLGTDAPGAAADAVGPGCGLPEFSRVGTIRPARVFAPASGVIGCFTDADGAAAVLVDDRDGGRTALVDGARLFDNEHLADDGNAALGLALLGQHDRVVWYVPSLADTDREAVGEPSLGDLTPDWLTPAIVLLLIAGVLAGVWRGRRFGPLVAETLPVTVRASETMHGRARLTAKAADAAHAASEIRTGAARRIARRLSLPDRATPGEVADAAADRLRVPRADVRALLTGPPPHDDRGLVDLARRLGDLAASVEATIRRERSTP